MVKVYIDVLGQDVKSVEVATGTTLGQIAQQNGYATGYTGTINGEPASMETVVENMSIVGFNKAVKGGMPGCKGKKKAKKTSK